MHVLKYLKDPLCTHQPNGTVSAEYRLLCSGSICRDTQGDLKSEVRKILLDPPFNLYAITWAFKEYPLEVALQVVVPRVLETRRINSSTSPTEDQPILNTFSSSFCPHEEVAKDIVALLCLLCRRLITVAGSVNEKHSGYEHALFQEKPIPTGLLSNLKKVYWQPHPLSVTVTTEGQEITNYNPPDKPINSNRLTKLLLILPKLEYAKNIVASARLYAVALELIHERPDIAYQLLISAVETMANSAYKDYAPTEEEKIKHQAGVYNLAIDSGINEDLAKSLALTATKTEHWVGKKFKKFLMENVDESIWSKEDDLFKISHTLPRRDNFEAVLGKIYSARSSATHKGEPFPLTAYYTGGPYISTDISIELMVSSIDGSDTFPAVVWFERIVNNALNNFWERSPEVTHSTETVS